MQTPSISQTFQFERWWVDECFFSGNFPVTHSSSNQHWQLIIWQNRLTSKPAWVRESESQIYRILYECVREELWARVIQIWIWMKSIHFVVHKFWYYFPYDFSQHTHTRHTSLLMLGSREFEFSTSGGRRKKCVGAREKKTVSKIISNSHQRTISIWIVMNGSKLFRQLWFRRCCVLFPIRINRSLNAHKRPTPHAW